MVSMDAEKKTFSFIGLLLIFVALFVLLPLSQYHKIVEFFIKVGFTAVIIFSVYIVARVRIRFVITILLALPVIIIKWSSIFDDEILFQIIRFAFAVALYSYVSFILLNNIFRAKFVNTNIICEAICVYMLLGIVWTKAYTLLELVMPGSFTGLPNIGAEVSIAALADFYVQPLFYYSYITITTLGYGNIAPITSAASSLAASEAIIGQLYLAILIAQLVGLHISQKTTR